MPVRCGVGVLWSRQRVEEFPEEIYRGDIREAFTEVHRGRRPGPTAQTSGSVEGCIAVSVPPDA